MQVYLSNESLSKLNNKQLVEISMGSQFHEDTRYFSRQLLTDRGHYEYISKLRTSAGLHNITKD
jgi:hypothetical protein